MSSSSDTLALCEELLATIAAAETHLRVLAALQLPFSSVLDVYRDSQVLAREHLEELGVAGPTLVGFADIGAGEDDTDELLRGALLADAMPPAAPTPEPASRRHRPPPKRAPSPVQVASNAPAVPLDDGSEGIADDTAPLATDEVSAEVVDLDDLGDDVIAFVEDDFELVPLDSVDDTIIDEGGKLVASLLGEEMDSEIELPEPEDLSDLDLDLALASDDPVAAPEPEPPPPPKPAPKPKPKPEPRPTLGEVAADRATDMSFVAEPLIEFDDEDDEDEEGVSPLYAAAQAAAGTDAEDTLVVRAEDLESLSEKETVTFGPQHYDLLSDEDVSDEDTEEGEISRDTGSVDEVIVTKAQAKASVKTKRKPPGRAKKAKRQPAQGAQAPAKPARKPVVAADEEDTHTAPPQVRAKADSNAATARRDGAAKFYAASAAVPTIRDDSTHKPRAAAIQLNPMGDGKPARVLGAEEEDMPIAVGGVEDEDELDLLEGGGFGVHLQEFEYDEEEEEDEYAEATPPPAAARIAPRGPSPAEVAAILVKAERAATEGNIDAGVALYSDVLDADPDNLTAHIGRGRLYLDLGDYARAMSDFTVSEELAPSSPEPQVAIGDLYFSRKDYRKAIEYFDAALLIQADHPMAFCRRGISHYYRRNYRQALQDLNEAVKLDPDIPNIKTFVAMARKKVKR